MGYSFTSSERPSVRPLNTQSMDISTTVSTTISHTLTPSAGSKVKYSNSQKLQVSQLSIVLIKTLHADRGTNGMKLIKRESGEKDCVCPSPWIDQGQKYNFPEYGHDVYQIKGNEVYSNMLINTLSLRTSSTLWIEAKGQNKLFSEISYVAYQIKGQEA